MKQTSNIPGVANGIEQHYRYDAHGRLALAAEHASALSGEPACPAAGSVWCLKFGYDQYGNRAVTARTSLTQPPSEPVSFDILSNRVTAPALSYDAAGNVLQMPPGLTMTYDAENRLTSGGGGVYSYDGLGRRVVRQANNVTTVYVYDYAGALAAEYDVGGAGPAMSCTTCYLTADHLGSTRVVTRESGAVAERKDYLPFGELITVSAGNPRMIGPLPAPGYEADAVRQKFTGKERDAETGLDYFGARYMSSAQGRFTSPDKPFADQDPYDPQSWNLYSYTRNNPLKFVDVDGYAITYADKRLEIISNARRQTSASYNTWLSGFEGKGSPDLTVRFGPTSVDPDGSPTDGVFSGKISPAIQTCSSATDCTVSSPATLKEGVITINNKIEGDADRVSDVMAHEVSHGNDARTNPERYKNERTTGPDGKVIPHDSRPVEQRAIGGARLSNEERKAFKKANPEAYKQIEKQQKEQLKQEEQRRKQGGN